MGNRVKTKGKGTRQTGAPVSQGGRSRGAGTKGGPSKSRSTGNSGESVRTQRSGRDAQLARRRDALRQMLLQKRHEIMNAIKEDLGHSVTEDQQRRLEGMDSGDQAVMDLERELGISLSEMRNRRRQLIDEALIRLEEGLYGTCADCGIEISEKRLAAVPFAKLCVECQSREELFEKIEKEEERD